MTGWQQPDQVKVLWEEDENGVPRTPHCGRWQWGRPGGNNDGFSHQSPAFPEWIREMTGKVYEEFSDESQTNVIEIYPPFYYYSSQTVTDAMSGVENVE